MSEYNHGFKVHNHDIDPSCREFTVTGGRRVGECLMAPPKSDAVNSPSHYTWLPVEAIEITERFNFCLGNALKYIMRADHKGNPEQDIRKAIWYLERELKRREK